MLPIWTRVGVFNYLPSSPVTYIFLQMTSRPLNYTASLIYIVRLYLVLASVGKH